VSGNFAVDGNTLYVDASNNRVGIGLTNPSVALDVSGTMNINGRISNPNIPAFRAIINTNLSRLPGFFIEFNNAVLNRGSHYNATNGRFTVPYPGLYFFSCSLSIDQTAATQSQVELVIYVNEVYTIGHIRGSHTNGRDTALTVTSLAYLNTNDYVQVLVTGSTGVILENTSYFCGYYIG
jgi:hypothetical protein